MNIMYGQTLPQRLTTPAKFNKPKLASRKLVTHINFIQWWTLQNNISIRIFSLY